MQIDTFGEYVRRRLAHWGNEFSLSRDCEYLGHQSKNMLQVLIEHKGEMPGRVQGFKPLEADRDALQIEFIISDMAREQVRTSCVMRAYFCGGGRRKVERYETALLLISNVEQDAKVKTALPKVDRYLRMVEIGTAQVRGVLVGLSQAA